LDDPNSKPVKSSPHFLENREHFFKNYTIIENSINFFLKEKDEAINYFIEIVRIPHTLSKPK
jgi:hypothetical protein